MFAVPQAIVGVIGGGGFTPYTDQLYGSESETISGSVVIPAAGHVRIRIDNAGGGGARTTGPATYGGSGGAYCEHYVAIAPADVGLHFNYTLGINGKGRIGATGPGTASAACSVTGTIAAGAVALATTAAGGGPTSGSPVISTSTGGNVSNVSGFASTGGEGGRSGSGMLGGDIGDVGSVGGGGGGGGAYVKDSLTQFDGGDGGVARLSFEWTA